MPHNTPIRRKLMVMLLLTSGIVLFMSMMASFVYEFLTFRHTAVRNITTLGEVIATNSTAALAFDNSEDAQGILSALRADSHIVAAALYDRDGSLFATYPESLLPSEVPAHPAPRGYGFGSAHLAGFQPVVENGRLMGTLYLRSDLEAIYSQLKLQGLIPDALGVLENVEIHR